MKDWSAENCQHLSSAEKNFSAKWLKLNPSDVDGPPKGLLVDEVLGAQLVPLLPHKNSTGGRLLKMSRLTPGQYMGRLARTFLVPDLNIFGWNAEHAQERADRLFKIIPEKGRVVLLGHRVGRAFGLDRFFTMLERDSIQIVVIPHPRLEGVMHDPLARSGIASAVQWAADLMNAPGRGEKRKR